MWIFDRLTSRMEGENHIYSSPYKSSISFISNLKIFQNTDLRIYSNFTFYPLGKEIGNDVTFPKEGSFIAPYDA